MTQQNLIDAARAVVAADRAGELTDALITALEKELTRAEAAQPAAAPVEASGGVSEWRNAVKALMDTAKAKEKECDGPDAPGHGHRVPGLWDATGKPCDWCAAWSRLRAMLL